MEIGSRFTFIIPIQRKAHITQAIIAVFKFSKYMRNDVPKIIHSDNAREYVAAAMVEAPRQMATRTSTTVPYNL